MDSYLARVDALDAPGDMGDAQGTLELVYELRASAMTEIADKVSTALGDVGSEKATAAIANQMEKLLASDVLYAAVVRPEIDAVLADNGIEGEDVPESDFVPDGAEWLDEDAVSEALSSVSGSSTGTATPGVHGLGLLGTSINGTELTPEGTTPVVAEETPEVEVEVQNQGEFDRERGRGHRHRERRHAATGHQQHRSRSDGNGDDPADAGAKRRK